MQFRIEGRHKKKHAISFELNFIDENASELMMWIRKVERKLEEGIMVEHGKTPVQKVVILKSDLKRLAKAI